MLKVLGNPVEVIICHDNNGINPGKLNDRKSCGLYL